VVAVRSPRKRHLGRVPLSYGKGDWEVTLGKLTLDIDLEPRHPSVGLDSNWTVETFDETPVHASCLKARSEISIDPTPACNCRHLPLCNYMEEEP
jgi:hypothetical protein